MTVGNERKTSHQDSTLEDCKGAVHLGSLGGLDSVTSCKFNLSRLAAWLTMHIDTHIAINTPKATQTFENSTSHLYPNESINDPPLAENTVDGNSLEPSLIETAGGVDWNDFYTASVAGIDWDSFYFASEVWTHAQDQATNI